MDLIGYLRRIMNKDASETFAQATDSLEAISEALGIGPSVGLWMFGRVAAGIASTTVITTDNLGTQLPTDVFNNEFYMQVLHNFNAPGTAPEREIRRITDFVGPTQTFTTDAFSANVEEGDLVAIIHESVLTIEILGFGTLTTSSATVPADNTRTEVDNYFNGCLLMPTEGACRFQPRRIVDYTGATGVFTLDPNNPFTGVPGLVDYIIIGGQCAFVPATDSVNNRTPEDVVGSKADTPQFNPTSITSSIIRFIKAILSNQVIATGTLTTSSATVPADNTRAEADNYFNGAMLMMVTGAVAFQPRRIVDYTGIGGIFTLDPNNPLTAVPGLVVYVVFVDQTEFVPTTDGVNNRTPSDVVGNKADTAIAVPDNVSSHIRYLKGLLTQITAARLGELDAANLPADIDLIKGYTDTLEAAIGAIEGATSLHNKLTAARALLLDRLALLAAGGAGELTPARAGYLEELAAANIPIDIDGLKTSRDRQLLSMDFWSNPQEEVSVPAIAATLALPSVTVADLPAGATIVRAIAIFKARMIENTNAAANKLNGATVAATSQVIQIQDSALSGWVDAINFVDDQFGIAATTREGGDVLMGSIDIAGAGKVDANDTYSVRWLLALADLASLNFNDCACGLRIWYSV